jgi:MFS family permease
MAHPYADLLKDRPVRALWTGLTLSALGSELYRVGALWIAAELAGPKASLLAAAQAAAMLAVSLAAGPLVEQLPGRRFIIAGELVSVVVSAAVVVAALTAGLSFPLLVAASVVLAAISAMARPVFLSSLPRLAPGHVREVNGLFDSTLRVAQAVGPMLAAMLMKIMPAIHLLTVNGASFLISAAAMTAVGHRLDPPRAPIAAARVGLLKRLGRGVAAASGCPGAWSVLVATGLRGGAYALGYAVAVPVLFAGQAGGGGLTAVAIVFGAGAATEIVSTPLLVLTHPARPLRRLFEGYALIGAGVAVLGLAAALPADWQVPAMAAAAVVVGFGNSVATLQMTTFFATRLPGDDYAAVLRLRYVTIIGSIMLATTAGPVILTALGTAPTIVACGLVTTAAGVAGILGGPARRLGPGFETA